MEQVEATGIAGADVVIGGVRAAVDAHAPVEDLEKFVFDEEAERRLFLSVCQVSLPKPLGICSDSSASRPALMTSESCWMKPPET